MKPRWLLFAGVGLLGALAGGLYAWQQEAPPAPPAGAEIPSPPAAAAELLGQPRPPWTLGAIDGRRVSAEDFDGQVVLVNFWATWCAPCRKEMPMLTEVHEAYETAGLSIVGIALDDLQQARDFVASLGIDYTILVGGADVMAAGAAYGNRAGLLPYSVLIDRQGVIRWTHLGELERGELESRLAPLL